MSEVNVHERLVAFMKWLPQKVAVRYSLTIDTIVGNVLSAHLVIVSYPNALHYCTNLSRFSGARPDRPRMYELESGKSPEQCVLSVLSGWQRDAKGNPAIAPWLEPGQFVGVVSRAGTDVVAQHRADAPVFGFYHGLLRERIFESGKLMRKAADEADSKLLGHAYMLTILYDRFGSFVGEVQGEVEERLS